MADKILVRITTVPLSLDKLLHGQLKFMRRFYKVIGISSEPEYLKRVGKREGVEVHCVEMTRQITPLKDLVSVWNLYNYFRKIKPQIVHSHTPKAGIVAMLAAKLAGVPNRLHTVAGLPLLEATGTKRKILNVVEKATYGFATKVYPNSFGLYNIILENKFCDKSKLKVLGNGSSNGIDTTHFSRENFSREQIDSLKSGLGISADDFTFVFVGRLVADKGLNELVAAFSNLSTQNPRLKLLLVGDYETELDPLSADTLQIINTNNKIISTGFQPDVRPYLAISNALAFPSYREGFPNVVMQAASMDLPCIVSDINGCNEIIREGENGLIIKVKDILTLEQAMHRVSTDENLYLSLQKQARLSITSRFEQQLLWQAVLDEYGSLD
ncbi:glycosyltransferase family 4 protein [Flavobacterium silvaticum]|uniref:Glycosyltransferase family 4 protein n=1 Tax=Flavobacterium silvaticum TaxID=1852020 RepID=A0A972FNV0_9FLAO|nr:glycosyltransferase family 4 protein [Flavobacterium silvaticum]NMH29499.1 glycosyltransferase family 4 protein [Flavobacterium silvaticum]